MGAGGGSVADWPTGQSLFLMSHPDVSLVNILLSITRVSLVKNKCVFCQLRVHYNINKYISSNGKLYTEDSRKPS